MGTTVVGGCVVGTAHVSATGVAPARMSAATGVTATPTVSATGGCSGRGTERECC